MVLWSSWLACTPSPPPPAAATEEAARLDHDAFVRAAFAADRGWFWVHDADGDGEVDADELVPLLGRPADPHPWVADGALTDAFRADLRAMSAVATVAEAPPAPDGSEARRMQLVRAELDQARPALVLSDLRDLPAPDLEMARHLLRVGDLVDGLFQAQRGSDGLQAPPDPASRALVWRNQGPWCSQPATRDDPECNALPSFPPERSGLYPADLQEDPAFCDDLDESLLTPFTAVRRVDGALAAVPYHEAWPDRVAAVHDELVAAADALGPDEAALATYLRAAAAAFLDDDWFAADEAWAAMHGAGSKWYVRVGPDETYAEPCDRKAQFHLTFARIDPSSAAWEQTLEPVKAQLEAHVAELTGAPYTAREVAFALPEFIAVVRNAGDDRRATGATIGQSLPNWGPVAEQSRGRTVAMTNLGQDAAALEALAPVTASVLCEDLAADWSPDPEPLVLSTVLHEASHNLGPNGSWRVDGVNDEAAFGGALASVLEELKAQTAAMALYGWLPSQGVLDDAMARRARAHDLVWALGKVAEGTYDGDDPLTYGQMAAIQLGVLQQTGAIAWRADEVAANGTDQGCLSVVDDRWDAGLDELARDVLGIKARNDAPAARALIEQHVDGEDARALAAILEERFGRVRAASYVYAVRMP
ncbi:MAG: hypothetical protein R3F59_16720 [Myxococcota bacterium]